MKLTMGEVAAFLGASCGVADRPVEGYSIDSRSLAPGQLFFAIRGPRFDGHQFVGQALDRGAAGAVVEDGLLRQRSGGMAARTACRCGHAQCATDACPRSSPPMGQAACGGHRQHREEHHEGNDRGHPQPAFSRAAFSGELEQ